MDDTLARAVLADLRASYLQRAEDHDASAAVLDARTNYNRDAAAFAEAHRKSAVRLRERASALDTALSALEAATGHALSKENDHADAAA